MLIYPSYEDFQKLVQLNEPDLQRAMPEGCCLEKAKAEGVNVIPVYKEILVDTETPVSAYLKIRGNSKYSFLLESIEGGEKIARYSFLGAAPFKIFRSKGDRITIEDRITGATEQMRDEPIAHLRRLVNQYRSAPVKDLPRFTGGTVGYVSYDAIRLIEDIPDRTKDDLDLDEIVFLFFDTILVFDNLSHKMFLICNIPVDGTGNLNEEYQKAQGKIEDLERLLLRPIDPLLSTGESRCEVTSNTKKEEFLKGVRRAKEYILAGDVIQVVLSQRFETEVSVDSFDIYRMLRIVNPSPYMYYMALNGVEIAGSSPELLVRFENGVVETRPIAGTRPRGSTDAEDKTLEKELLSDQKEQAEHIMLLDLGRNDLGKISEYGSVEVTELMSVERYSHVMHIVSNVNGRLKKGADQFDALFACFPAGTVSGAPKIRAMEIIDELEPTKRSIYAGAIGYLDLSGNLDSCIAIRTILFKDGKAYIQAGAGIVADSVPEREFEETVNKAKAMIEAIQMAENHGIQH